MVMKRGVNPVQTETTADATNAGANEGPTEMDLRRMLGMWTYGECL